jgi:hypothetical protein
MRNFWTKRRLKLKLQIVDGEFGKEMRQCPDDVKDGVSVLEVAKGICRMGADDQAAFISELFNQVGFHPTARRYLGHPAVLENLTRFIYETYIESVGYDGRNSHLTIEISKLCHLAIANPIMRGFRGNNATYIMVE